MGPTQAGVTPKTGYHHGDLRGQLIAATRALVEEKGPDGFSVSEACRAAGVSTAAPYKHFADRREMLQAVALQGYAEMREGFERELEGVAPGTAAAVARIGAAYVAFAEANPEVFRMMFAFKDKTDAMMEAGMACYGVLLDQVRRCMGRAEVDAAVMARAFPLWTFVHGLSFLRIDGKATEDKMSADVPALVTDAARRFLA